MHRKIPTLQSKCRYNLHSFLDISPVYLTGGISNLGDISFTCKENGLPPISALVVNKDERMPGAGFFAAYCPEKKGDDLPEVWMDIFNKIHAYQGWYAVVEAYKKLC